MHLRWQHVQIVLIVLLTAATGFFYTQSHSIKAQQTETRRLLSLQFHNHLGIAIDHCKLIKNDQKLRDLEASMNWNDPITDTYNLGIELRDGIVAQQVSLEKITNIYDSTIDETDFGTRLEQAFEILSNNVRIWDNQKQAITYPENTEQLDQVCHDMEVLRDNLSESLLEQGNANELNSTLNLLAQKIQVEQLQTYLEESH